MKKEYILFLLLVIVIFAGADFIEVRKGSQKNAKTVTLSVQFVKSTISAEGAVTAEDQAKLSFQTPGKLIYLPFKEGDTVYEGQTIASLDTYVLRQQLQLAANAYEATKNNTDQAIENYQAGIIEGQQRYSLDTSNKSGYAAIPEATVIYDAVQRIVDNDLLTQKSAQINVDLANYAVQLSGLTSPVNGIITHEDVTVPGVNVTTLTSFTVADPNTMVFRANIPAVSIYYVSEGATATLAIDGIQDKLQGTIVKIYPSKVTLQSGEEVYQADIASDQLKGMGKLEASGTAIINTNAKNVALVPAWTVLSGKYIWIDNNGVPVLKQVTTGQIHGNEIEITGGLSPSDNVLIDPKFVSSQKYQLL